MKIQYKRFTIRYGLVVGARQAGSMQPSIGLTENEESAATFG